MKGSCLCGSMTYEVSRLAGPIVHCHCRTCRKAHAAAFTSTARVEQADFRWLSGQENLGSFESSPGKFRHFCMKCGTHLIAELPTQSQVILRVATLDEDPGGKPIARIWLSHEVAWLEHGSELPSFQEAPAKKS